MEQDNEGTANSHYAEHKEEPKPLVNMQSPRTKEAMLVFVGVLVATAVMFNWTNVVLAGFIAMLVYFREAVYKLLEKVNKGNAKGNQTNKENK